MHKTLVFIFFFVVINCSFAQKNKTYRSFDPASSINTIGGSPWVSEVKNTYDRLPARAEKTVRKEVWYLSTQAAGLNIQFKTNADEIIVKYAVSGKKEMPHMPATGVSGVDLYAQSSDKKWLWSAGKYSFGDTIVYHFTNLTKDDNRIYTLYLPTYNHVQWMDISVPSDASFTALEATKEKPVVVYGTSIAHGACASRPGLSWPNILSRKIEQPVINLAFSGNGRLEKPLIDLMTEIDAKVYVLDCLPNLVGETYITGEGNLKKRLIDAISTLQEKRPGVPILLTDHAGYTNESTSEVRKISYENANKIQIAVFDSLISAGVKNLYRLKKSDIGQHIETMVDGTHPNDMGMMLYAEAYAKKLKKLLKK